MPLPHIEAWDDLLQRAKNAGIRIIFNHDGVAVLQRAAPSPVAPPAPAPAASVEADVAKPA